MQEVTIPQVLCILLGASNLSRAHFGLVKYLEQNLHPRSVRFLSALGSGRGYSVEGGLMNIVYPPIKSCGVFDAAREVEVNRVIALITDVGNDIMYGIPVEKIIADLTELFEKLHNLKADILVTLIPHHLEIGLDDFYFRCLRAIFYPGCRVAQNTATAAVREINRFLKASASDHIKLITGLNPYYGMDMIHFSTFQMHRAWTQVAGEMLHALDIEPVNKLGIPETIRSLGSHILRLTLSEMFPICEKGPDLF